MLRPLSRFWKDSSGAVAIEFALIAPMLLALLFGIVCLGYFMGLSHSVNQLATGAARASVAGLDTAERRALAQDYLDAAGAHFPLLAAEALTPSIAFGAGPPSAITVSVSYDLDGSLLELANGFLALDLSSIDRSAYLAY